MRWKLCLLFLLWPALVAAQPRPELYGNPRYGFQIEIPPGFRPLDAAENGDGQAFESQDQKARITVYGSNNIANDTAETLTASNIRACPGKIAYKARGKNWFVLSWSEGTSITYMKGLVGAGSSNTLLVVYPKNQRKRFDPMVTRLEATFKAGDLSQAH